MISGISERNITAPDGVDTIVVKPHGELDLSGVAAFDSALKSAMTTAGTQPRLVVDLSEVSVLAPVVLGVLLDARRRCRTSGGALSLVVTEPAVADALADTEIADLFPTAANLPQAVQLLCEE